MRFKITLLILALFAATFTALAAHRVSRATETEDQTYELRAGAPLAIETFNGSIHVRAGDDASVHVTMKKHVQAETEEEARRAMASLRVEVSHENGGLSLRAPNLRDNDDIDGGVNFEVTMPRTANLTLTTTNGSIDVYGIGGDHVVRTTNGQISVMRGAGSVDAETTNGGIRAELSQVNPSHRLRFVTTNGGVSLELPQSLNADVEASTTNGTISTDLPISASRADRHRLSGRINGGGTELRVQTTNGTIDIRTSSTRE